jgi:glutamate decarboxylase
MMDQLAEDIIGACKYLDKHGGTAIPPSLHAKKISPKC